jgi:hypothetical protein
MAKSRVNREEKVERANPLVLFAKLMGLLALLLGVCTAIWALLSRGGAFDPGPRERVTKNSPLLKPAMKPDEVRGLLGPPRDTSPRELVGLLGRSGIDPQRITLTQSPHFRSGARGWEPPVDRVYLFRTDEQGPQTKGNLLLRESTLTFDKDGNWSFDLGDLTTLDGQRLGPPKKTPDAAFKSKETPKGGLPKGPAAPGGLSGKRVEHWLYYFRAIQRPKTDEGPIQFFVLTTFEDQSLTSVLRGDVDVRGLPRPDGGTFAK